MKLYYKEILKAYENEIEIDRDYLKKNNLNIFPTFKVIKLLSLKKRTGNFYFIFICVYLFTFPFLLFILIIFLLLFKIFYKKKLKDYVLIPRIPSNSKQILQQISNNINIAYEDVSIFDRTNIFNYGTINNAYNSIINLLALVYHIFLKKRGEKLSLFFHIYDSLYLIYLYEILINYQKNKCFITDNHYQRWNYLISHLSKNNIVIQHGYIDANIKFPHNFGNIKKLIYLKESDLSIFNHYYDISESELLKLNFRFSKDTIETSKKIIFFASSYPFLNEELALLDYLQGLRCQYYIVFKFHPNHNYDRASKNKINFLVDLVWKKIDYPYCNIFISYNSYLKELLKTQKVIIYNIKDFGSSKSFINENLL